MPTDFSAIYRRESAFVSGLARRLGARPSDIEDVSQEVFFRVAHLLANYDGSRPIRPWLYAIVFRVVAERKRWVTRGGTLSSASLEVVDFLDDPECAAIRAQQQRVVVAVLERIPVRRRAVFVAHELEGYSVPTVARRMNIPLNTAYSRLRVARGEFVSHMRGL